MTKPLPVSKRMVYESYLKACEKKGSAGIDRETLEMFNANLKENLYKLWNRMTSGSYFPPPVRTVLIPKKSGGMRPLGIPTVSDRIVHLPTALTMSGRSKTGLIYAGWRWSNKPAFARL